MRRQVDTYRGPWNAPTSPILVIGNTTDPSTPLRDAVAMTRQLANARLLIVHGYGHTAFLNPSTCAQNYVTAYFRTGALPPTGRHASKTAPHSHGRPGNASCAAIRQPLLERREPRSPCPARRTDRRRGNCTLPGMQPRERARMPVASPTSRPISLTAVPSEDRPFWISGARAGMRPARAPSR